ncbi:MAG: Fe-S cluster assembly protein SufD, partial [Planctomycetota bacterium]
FLHIPRGVAIREPFCATFFEPGGKSASLPYILIYLEEGSQASFFFQTLGGEEGFRNGRLEILLEDNSSLHIGEIQGLSEKALYFWNGKALVGRDGRISSLFANFGASLLKNKLEVHLLKPGGEAKLNGVYFTSGRQHFDQRTVQYHDAPHTTSNLFYRGALKDKSHAVYQGLIDVEKRAVKTNAYQTNNNLLLTDHARADSIPSLEIKANDLKCSHGATVGKLDENQIFYLMTRGFSQEEARTLLIMGFFEEVIQETPKELHRIIKGKVAQKLGISYNDEDDLEFETGR